MKYSVFVNRNIFLLWVGHLISHAGDAVFMIALPWLLLDMTGSKTTASIITMTAYLPSLLFGLLAGAVADTYSRKWVMIISDLSRALLVMMIPIALLTGFATPVFIGIVTFLVASMATPFYPARDAMLPDIVPVEDLTGANSIISTSGQLSHLFGPFMAGILVQWVGLVHLFTIDAISFSASLICVALIRLSHHRKPGKAHNHMELMRSGLRYLSGNKALVFLLIITAVNNFFIMGLAIIGIPVYVREVLDNSFTTLAKLETFMAAGMVLGSVLIWRFFRQSNPYVLLLTGFVLDGLTYSLIYFIHQPIWAYLLLLIHGLGIPFITVSRTLIIQLVVTKEFRGRVFSLVNMAVMGTTAISVVSMGLILEFISVQTTFMLFGIFAALCMIPGVLSTELTQLKNRLKAM